MNIACRFSQSPRLIFAALYALGILCNTLSAANPVIKITPDKFSVGMTKSINVECSFNKSAAQTFATLYSLVMLHAINNSADHFTHLISVSSEGRLLNGSSLRSASTASGAINSNGVSSLNITWQIPKEERAGVYKCEAHGADPIGRPVSLSSAARAKVTSPNMDMAVAEINSVRKDLGVLHLKCSTSEGQIRSLSAITTYLQLQFSNLTNNFSVEIEVFKRSVSLLHNRIVRLEAQASVVSHQQDKTKNTLENAKRSMFLPSSAYNHRRYWLTRYSSFFNPGYAQATCQTYGGYLAELDTREEYNFVRNFVRLHGSSNHWVMLGGTDEGHEGRWINMHSKTRMATFWHPGQPDNDRGKENCLCLWKTANFAMNDCLCYFVSEVVAFVCEIPE